MTDSLLEQNACRKHVCPFVATQMAQTGLGGLVTSSSFPAEVPGSYPGHDSRCAQRETFLPSWRKGPKSLLPDTGSSPELAQGQI